MIIVKQNIKQKIDTKLITSFILYFISSCEMIILQRNKKYVQVSYKKQK